MTWQLVPTERCITENMEGDVVISSEYTRTFVLLEDSDPPDEQTFTPRTLSQFAFVAAQVAAAGVPDDALLHMDGSQVTAAWNDRALRAAWAQTGGEE